MRGLFCLFYLVHRPKNKPALKHSMDAHKADLQELIIPD